MSCRTQYVIANEHFDRDKPANSLFKDLKMAVDD